MRLFLINGYPESGKDTFIQILGEELGIHTVTLWTSTPAKSALRMLGWSGVEKTPEVRSALNALMTISEKVFDGVDKYIQSELENIDDPNAVVFIHVRESWRIQRYVDKYGADTVLVRRDAKIRNWGNSSDSSSIDMYPYDYVIDNNRDLDWLRQKAKKFKSEVLKR